MMTGEPGLPLGRCFRPRPHFAHCNNPKGALPLHADPWRRYPNRALAVPRPAKARARLTDLEEEDGNVGAIEPQTLT